MEDGMTFEEWWHTPMSNGKLPGDYFADYALAEIAWHAGAEQASKALVPFAKMARDDDDPEEVACVRGTASDATMLTSADFAEARRVLQENCSHDWEREPKGICSGEKKLTCRICDKQDSVCMPY
jgi:hypothetical protein